MIILRATNDNGVKVDLDVFEGNTPIRVDISAIENGTIGDVFGVSSQTFSLPGTDKNNQFFGNLYDLGTTPAIALQDSIDCQVLQDGQEVFTGKLYILDIVTDQRGYTTYQVNVVNETVDFKFLLTDTLISELNWDSYTHDYTLANITGSWNNDLFGGEIIYPNVNYGRPEGDASAPNYAFSNSTTGRTFDKSSYPLRVVDFKPAIKVKSIIDKIFNSVDYKYESNFFSSSYFDNLYTLMTSNDQLGANTDDPAFGAVWAYAVAGQNFNAVTPYKVNFTAENYDNYNRFDLLNDKYTAYADGFYNFALGFTFSISNYGVNNRNRFVVNIKKNGTGSGPGRVYVDPPQNGALYIPLPNIYLDAGDYVEMYIEFITDDGSEVITLGSGENSTYFKVEGPQSVGGGTVDMSLQFPKDLRALDFLDGLIQKFNLVVEPIPGERNLLRIEPYQSWVDQGTVKDWTDKVDRNTRFKIVHPITEQPKVIYFRDEDDEASPNKYTMDNFGEVFGTHRYSNESDLPVGEKTIGKTFAATPVKGIPGGDSFIVPQLARRSDDGTYRPFQFKPRLLYANGLKDASDAVGYDTDTSTTYPGQYFMIDHLGNKSRHSQFYQMSNLSDIPATFNSTLDLHFNNLRWYQYFQQVQDGRAYKGAYNTYWATYINSLYDIDARKLTCNVYLEPSDIPNIALNDKIFIDGHYYRINKISGANLTNAASVEVELIKELNRQLIFPRRRVFDIGDTPVDITVQNIDASGRVTYVNFDDGAAVTDYGLVSQAGFKDGFTVYQSGSESNTTWFGPAVVSIQPDQNIAGSNNVDISAGAMFVAGGNNTVGTKVESLSVIGENNDIGSGTNNISVSGRNNTIEPLNTDISIIQANNVDITGVVSNTVVLGGGSNVIDDSSLVTIVNSPGSDILNSETSRVNIIGGLNVTVSSSQSTVALNLNGETVTDMNGNTLIGNFQDTLTITGSDFRSGTNILAGTYIEEDLYTNRNSHQVEAYKNSIEYAYSGTGLFKYIYELTFNSLASGSGQGTIELPGIISQDQIGRTILFKCDDTISPSSSISITSFGGTDNIEGAASYTLNQPYQTVTLRASQYPSGESLITEWRVIGTSTGTGGLGEGYGYGNFFSSGSQPLITPGVSQSVLLDSTYEANGVHIASGSRIYFDTAGTYQFSYVVQIANASNQPKDANFWIKYNGVDYPNSNTFISVIEEKNPANPSYQLMSATFTGTAQNDNDYVELWWDGDSTDLSLYSTGSNGHPATPSVIANVIPVGVITSGGGGSAFPYTGSAEITGSLTINNVRAEYISPTATYLRPIAQTFTVPLGGVNDYHISGSGRYRFDMINYAGQTNAGKINIYFWADLIPEYSDVQIEWKIPAATAFNTMATGQNIITGSASTEYYLTNVWSGLTSWNVFSYQTSTKTFLQHSGFEPDCFTSVVKNGDGEIYISNNQNPEEGPAYVLYSGSLGTPLT